MEVLHGWYWLIAQDVNATSHYPRASQRFQLAALIGLELREVRESWRMRYDVVLLSSSSRPRDVLSDKGGDAELIGLSRYMP